MNSEKEGNDENIYILLCSSKGASSRKQIMKVLLQKPYNCHQLAKQVNLEWWTVQKHLTVLLNKNIINVTTIGRIRYYKINKIHEKTVLRILPTNK